MGSTIQVESASRAGGVPEQVEPYLQRRAAHTCDEESFVSADWAAVVDF